MRTRIEEPCGCHVYSNRIVHCDGHAKAQAMATLLNQIRLYFLETTGEVSPIVKKIDQLIPRREELPQ